LQPESTLFTATNLSPLGALLHQVSASLWPNKGSPLAVQISPHTPLTKVAHSFHNLENSPPVCAPLLCSTAFSPLDKADLFVSGLPVACLSRHRLKICTKHTPTPLGTHTGSGVDALITYKRKHSVQCKRRDLMLRCSRLLLALQMQLTKRCKWHLSHLNVNANVTRLGRNSPSQSLINNLLITD
jgi:hypothetical protein